MATSIPSRAIPEMDWDSEDKVQSFQNYKRRMQMYLAVTKVDAAMQWNHIVLLMGDEGLRRWDAINMDDEDKKDPAKVWTKFEDSLEKTKSFWGYIDEYLSDVRQGPTESTAELDVRIQTLVRKCNFPQDQIESRKLELLYHASRHFEVKKYCKEKDRKDITYNIILEQAKLHERVIDEYRAHKENAGDPVYTERSATKVKEEQAEINAVRRGQTFGRRKEEKRCDKCGTTHRPRDCPAYGKDCYKCGGRNHWASVCRSRPSDTDDSRSPSRDRDRGRRDRGRDSR